MSEERIDGRNTPRGVVARFGEVNCSRWKIGSEKRQDGNDMDLVNTPHPERSHGLFGETHLTPSRSKPKADPHGELTWKHLRIRQSPVLSMARTILSLIAYFALLAVSHASDWVLYSVGGRDYISMGNVADFYGLKNVQRDGNEVVASSNSRSLRAAAGSVEFFINNLIFHTDVLTRIYTPTHSSPSPTYTHTRTPSLRSQTYMHTHT